MRLFARVAVYALLATPLAFSLAAGCGSSGNQPSGSGSSTSSAGSSVGGSGTASTGSNTGGGANAGGASSTSTGSSTASGVPVPTEIATCQGKVYTCGDLLDNDNDGLIDSQDPDCLGPCDNTEDSYYGGISGQNNAPCKMDCYFDQDTGTGNDDCYWDHKCDPHEIAPDYYPESDVGNMCAYNPATTADGKTCAELNAAQSDTCHNYCGPLTPNGCDCFGCCELPAGGGNYVWLGSVDSGKNGTCDLANVADPTKCHPCKPVDSCFNGCGKCEICIGKPTVPPECFPPDGGTPTTTSTSTSSSSSSSGAGGGGPVDAQCPDGIQPCGLPGQAACIVNYTCITGCCQKVPQ